jgi:hypothetical protein
VAATVTKNEKNNFNFEIKISVSVTFDCVERAMLRIIRQDWRSRLSRPIEIEISRHAEKSNLFEK